MLARFLLTTPANYNMKKILCIIGSPRSFGNCEILIKEISKHIEVEHELSLLRLSDFELKSCNGCYQCLFEEMTCNIKDDLYHIINAMTYADAMIVAIPTYFFKANSSLHNLMDRGLALYRDADNLWNKPVIGIGVSGIEGKEGSTLLDIERFFKVIQAEVKETTIMNGRLPGDIFLNESNIRKAKDLAKRLFTTSAKKEFSCSLCGGDTFRFLSPTEVKCMLCSHSGKLKTVNEKLSLEMEEVNDGILLNREQAIEHLEWLREMKKDYMAKRIDLKKVKANYIGDWKWIKP